MNSADQSNTDQSALTEYLRTFLTAERQAKIEAVLAQRTRYVTVVLEDVYLTQNASAVLRNCDSFGVQDVHIVENQAGFKINRDVTRGCNKWLTLHRYAEQQGNTAACLQRLKQQGYRLVATTPHTEALYLPELPLDRPLALLFGGEQAGLSTAALTQADLQLRIPMYGFSESFNLSVSVALCLQSLCDRIRPSQLPWPLTTAEKSQLRLAWYRKSFPASDRLDKLEKRFWQQRAAG
ncbi:MAG: RNA methyltransferase [Leptolyngbya sp. SIO4C1]|nr:RNA methyltransferase [Leptolyngbya sp. SIO4C1]